MRIKKDKSIGLSPTTRMNLELQTIERPGIHYKLHCEQIMERASKMSVSDLNIWLGSSSVVEKKARRKVAESSVEVEEDSVVTAEKSKFDKTGTVESSK